MLHLEHFADLTALALPTPGSDGSLLHFCFQKMPVPNSEFIHDVLGDADGMVFLNRETGDQRQEGEGPVWGLGRHAGDHSRILRRGFGIGIGFAHGGVRGHGEGAG